MTVLPYGGHDGDGEEKCVGEGPLIAPALPLGFIFFLFPLFFHPFPSDYRGFLWPFLVHTVLVSFLDLVIGQLENLTILWRQQNGTIEPTVNDPNIDDNK